ncbi:hypothetical protein PPL_11476 [Heterostelium album PN500]|uniref:Ubiquinol-cytochrome c chaperone domain-containing protein n=1 Tax=Heterostelium pallidum (strain ATCC 26659 / Pp 5 / PN500) TaxID=670386 RepID=D3BTI0_HETP5|nr:hypothetical protein PPL_11476 [Heterostelium album PN500]EFA75397.1 hypothetical protein PPL_11476 [Heterostelium album PN500]|eukprot:XP_020427531.1 hypothetical protein PPL_11476 [Heterostelium album PN500]
MFRTILNRSFLVVRNSQQQQSKLLSLNVRYYSNRNEHVVKTNSNEGDEILKKYKQQQQQLKQQQQQNDPSIKVDESLLKYEPSEKNIMKIDELVDPAKQKWYLKLMGLYTKDTLFLNISHSIYDSIAIHTSNPALYKSVGLPLTVRSWFAMTLLHMWMVFVRLRKDGKVANKLSTDIYDRFWEDLEKRIVRGGIQHKFAAKYLKEFYTNYLGSVVAYDEGLFDDVIMADALWRNLLAMSEDASMSQIDFMVKYIRVQLNKLDNSPNVGTRGEITFDDVSTIQ